MDYHQHCLIRLPSEGTKLIEIRPNGIVKLGKFGTFSVDQIVGYPYGQSFEILDGINVRPIEGSLVDNAPDATETEGAVTEVEEEETSREATPQFKSLSEKIDYLKKLDVKSSETNRNLVDIGSSTQELTQEEIETLKVTASGAAVGEAIIDKLIKSHVNFGHKTKHSQQKYLRRKQQKFLRRFTVDYLGAEQLLQYYLEKDASRVLDMSDESLALLLSLSNVQPGGRYLVVDETGGVVVSAMLERMRGSGEILVVHENEHVNHSALSYSNFSQDVLKRMVKTINFLQFFEPETERVNFEELTEAELKDLKSNKKAHYYRRKQNAKDTNEAIDNALRGEFDGLIMATTLYIPTLLTKLEQYVAGSRPIVVYSQFKEVLVETQVQAMNDHNLLAPTLHESRCRPYQTILGRLHPLMSMKGGGGFLFSALRVLPLKEGVQAVGRGLSKKRKAEEDAMGSEEASKKQATEDTKDEVME